MKNTGKLERLIASLTKNEKAYFRRWTLNSDKEKQYIEVFRIIDKKPTITTEKLLAKLGSNINLKKLNTLKTHLWSVLILSLRDYHRKAELPLEMNARLDGIKVLRKKGLLDLAFKDAERLLSDSEEMEMFSVALQALDHIENIYALQGLSEKKSDSIWENLYQKKERISLHLAEINRIRPIERKLKLINDRLGVSLTSEVHKKLVSQLLNQLNEIHVSADACFDVQFRYYQTLAISSRMLNLRVDEQKWFGKIVALLEENPIITKTYYSAFYVVGIHNYVDALLYLRRFEKVPELLQLMKARVGENPAMAGRDFFILANDTLFYHILTEDYEIGLKEWGFFEREQPKYNEEVRQDALARFLIQGSVLCFWNGEYKRALSALRLLFKQLDLVEGADMINVARMLEILCNYELGDIEHTEHLVGSFLRKQSTVDTSSQMEILVVQTISQELKTSKTASESWETLSQSLEALCDIPDEKDKLLTFDMIKHTKRKAGLMN